MAIAAGTVWEYNASATAGNVNGGGFNTANANMLADLTTDAGTGNTATPIVSSASYSFVAGDAGKLLYIKSGTNWTPGFYPITSVSAGKATINAAIGSGTQYSSAFNRYILSTVAGVATTGTPTAGTFGIDYSTATTAVVNGVTDFAAVGASTTLTSATAAFTPVMVGNLFHQTTTGTGAFGVVGWYEIVSYTNATAVVLDRTPNSGTASVACTGYIGGALSLNSTIDSAGMAAQVAGNFVFLKSGTFTLGQAVTQAPGTKLLPIISEGYGTIRGDSVTPFGASPTAPLINCATFALTLGQYCFYESVGFTGTAATAVTASANTGLFGCKFTNTSNTTGRTAIATGSGYFIGNEVVSQFGIGLFPGTSCVVMGNFFHDSTTGLGSQNGVPLINSNVFLACRTSGMDAGQPAGLVITNNTFQGYSNTVRGTAIRGTIGAQFIALSNIISNWTLGMTASVIQPSNFCNYNSFFNNTTNVTNANTGPNDIVGTNPSYIDVTELTGSTATTSGSVLTQGTANFSTVTDNVDYLQLHSGTGITAGCYLITAHTATTVTLNVAPGTSATADKVWTITTGKNLGIGTGLKALGYPRSFPGSTSTSYNDPGAVERQEAGGSAATVAYTFVG